MGDQSSLSFGALLKRHRRAANLTQEQLAERAGYSVSYVSMLERGERGPVRATLDLLADALGLSPAERTALDAASRARDALSAMPAPPSFARDAGISQLPLAGRAAELARIERHLTGEGPPLLLLAGEPGIGKSRLLAEVCVRAPSAGWTTLSGAAQRSGGHMPFTPLLEAIERHVAGRSPVELRADLQGTAWLGRLLPELVETQALPQHTWALPPEQERRLVFAAVARYLANVAGPVGTLLVLDDVQWAGADALDLLASLLRSGAATRVRVLGAYRDDDIQPNSALVAHLADLAAAGLVAHMQLGPLTAQESALLVNEALPPGEHQAGKDIAGIIARGAGVPFYLVSYAQSLATTSSDAATSSDQATDVPWDVAQALGHRVAALSHTAQEILEVAALAGGGVARAVLLAASRSSQVEDGLADALDATCRARLLVEDGQYAYEFTHELVRDVVLHGIGSARRAALHLRIAEALEHVPGEQPVEALAFHFMHAGEATRAISYLEQAAARARAMQALSAAAVHYRELIASLDRLRRTREAAYAREQLGEVLTVAARYHEALNTLEQAVRMYRLLGASEEEGRTVAQIGLVHAALGDAAAGIARVEPLVLGETAAALAPAGLAALWDALAQLYHIGGRYSEQLDATTRASEFARSDGNARLRAQVQMRHGNALRMLGRMQEATQVLEEASRLAEAAGDEQNRAFALENASVVYLLQGRLEQTERYVQRALELIQPLGDPMLVALMTLRRGMTSYVVGAWDAALADYERAEEMTQGIGVTWVSAYTAIGLGQLRLAQGDIQTAERELTLAVDLASRSGDLQALRWAQTALAEWDILSGRPQSARDRLEPLLDRAGLQEGLVTYLLPYLAWAAMELGDIEHARGSLAACLARAHAEHIHLALVDAVRVQALLALTVGGADSLTTLTSATSALEDGIAVCRAMPYPYAEAKLLYALGLLLRASGDVSGACAKWDEALRILGGLEERLYAERIASARKALPA